MRHLRFRVLLLACLGIAPAVRAQTAVCNVAAAAAEQRHDIPAGLLRAIGQVESGRRDAASGQVAAWPWAINAEGAGRLFDSAGEALAATRALRERGVASVDVGCFQVNLVHHPAAFATLEEGFDPDHNADYAARFLKSLRARSGSWEEAVAAYHSATPERGGPYRDRVLAAWGRAGAVPGPAPILPPPAPVVRTVSWSSGPGGMRIWSPSAAGQGASVISLLPARVPRG